MIVAASFQAADDLTSSTSSFTAPARIADTVPANWLRALVFIARPSRSSRVVAAQAARALVQARKETPVLFLDEAEVREQLRAAFGELREAAALAAGDALHQRLAREVVHVLDGIPGALVAEACRLGRMGDRAEPLDLGQQRDAAVTGEPFAFGADPQVGN